jgi:hypothetical protein
MFEFRDESPEERFEYKPNRVPNKKELKDLPKNRPSISGEGRYKNVFSADAALNRKNGSKPNVFYANLQRWVFYLS